MEINNFKVIEKIGKGPTGRLYKVIDKNTNEIFALKEIPINKID